MIAIVVALPVAGYFLLWQGQLEELEAGKGGTKMRAGIALQGEPERRYGND